MKLCTWLPRSLGVKRCLQKAERRPSVVSKEGCTGYLIPVIVWGASQSPREAKGCLPVTSQPLGLLSVPQDFKTKGKQFHCGLYQRNWARTGLVQNLRPERRQKALEAFPLGEGGGGGVHAGTSKINLTGKGRKVR